MITSLFSSNKCRRYIVMLLLATILTTGLLIALDVASFAIEDIDTLQTDAPSAILFDARRGQVLYSKASDEHIHSPLVNRLVTALIVLEKADTEALIITSKDAANVEGATLKLSVGEKYAVKNLLDASLLTGSPDATLVLAEHIGGSEEGFVNLMNEFAMNLGMQNTHFTDSIGSFDEDQYTTVDDMVILVQYALKNNSFNRLFATKAKPWYYTTKTLLLTNTNNMFWSYPGTDGGITAGYDAEFQSIITTVTKNSMRLVCILIDVPTKSMYNDSINILNYGFDNFMIGSLVAAGTSQQSLTVEGQPLNLVVQSDVNYVFPKGQDYIRDVTISIDQSKLKPPITTSTIVGTLAFVLEDDTIINVDLYPDREILPQKTRKQILMERLMANKELVILIIGLIVLEIILAGAKLYRYIKKWAIKKNSKRAYTKPRYRYKK
ncbi:MAG: D-alanyl-D-alanine carboxypeptidase family protein [Acetivibrionales bacterium]|jgi:D-alanyl-D-alanine carboxypeptidase (penicillin-binding protein 5/6)|nr:D-alanyl-D-alanine carboxypeptidase [Clostridiaceae bacterium]